MTRTYLIVILGIFFLHTSCNEGDQPIDISDLVEQTECDEVAHVDLDYPIQEIESMHTIQEYFIDGNCFEITFSASGCDGNTWEHSLIASPEVAESLPPQRSCKMLFINSEDCEAYITKIISFDVSEFQVENTNSVLLNFENSGSSVLYQY